MILRGFYRSSVKSPRESWCNLVINFVRFLITSQLHVSSRILGPPDQDPDSNGMDSSVSSEQHLVSNLVRIQETSQLHVSSRNSSFPQEKRAIPCRILFRSFTELERKLHGSPLGVYEETGRWLSSSLQKETILSVFTPSCCSGVLRACY